MDLETIHDVLRTIGLDVLIWATRNGTLKLGGKSGGKSGASRGRQGKEILVFQQVTDSSAPCIDFESFL
jgi:hypothetical protein